MELTSQKMRKLAPELDPLRLGTGWTPDELSKPQIIVESTFGDSHPGSGHLDKLVNAACKGAAEAGGHGARYFATDICDGESQGTDGINFSLASREMIANMIEIHANATPFDGGVYISSCDKGMPANLMGLARVNIPSVVVTGGTMHAGPELLTLEQLGMYSAKYERGEIDEAKLNWAKQNACPSCGACSFIGTASTMQIMAEALGLALPGSALLPATSPDLVEYARRAGYQAVVLAKQGLRPSDIVTMDSFENAIMVHAAISGSTNALLHLPAIAHEFGISIDGDTFDRLHRGAKYLLDIRPAGRWPAEFFYYAGGVPAIMEEIRDVLHLDAMTITGKTLGENLDELKANGVQQGPSQQAYGCDIPDDLCYQWAEDYFRNPDAKEDQGDEEKFVPQPYRGKASSKSVSKKKKEEKKKEPEKKAPPKKAEADDGQISLGELSSFGEVA